MKKIFKLEYFAYFISLCLPVYLIKASVFGAPSNLLEIFIIILSASWLFSGRYKNIKIGEFWESNRNYILATTAIFFGLFASALVNGNYQTSLGIIKGWFFFPILFFLILANIFDTRKAKMAFLALYLSGFLMAIISLGYFLLGRLTFDGRLEAFFNSPNYLAMYLAPAVVIGVAWAEENKKVYLPTLAIIILSLYLTYSYASWLALFISLASMSIFQKKICKEFILMSLVIVLFLFFQLGTTKWMDNINLKERSAISSRVMIWRSAQRIIKDNLVWGIGPGNFQGKYLEYQKEFPPYLEWAVPHPHSLYLTFWLQAGIFGLAGFLALIFFWLKRALKNKNQMTAIALGILVYVLMHGLVDTTYFKNDLAVIFWLTFLPILKKESLGNPSVITELKER